MLEIKVTVHADESMLTVARLLAQAAQPTAEPAPAPTVPAAPPKAEAAPAAKAESPQPVPTTARTYTREEVARAAVALMEQDRDKYLPQLQALTQQFGAAALTEVPADKLGDYAAALRQMGAKI